MTKLRSLAVLALGGTCMFAQDGPQTNSGLVSVESIITVETRHEPDKNVPSVKQEDVMVYEGRERLQVTSLVPAKGENGGLELFLLLDDASGFSLGSQLGDLHHFVETQPAMTLVGIGYMQNGMTRILQDLTADHNRASRALRLPLSSAGVMPSPYLSLSDLIKRWPESPNRREVVLISSGVDLLGDMGPTNSYLDSAIEEAQRHGMIVYAIYTPGGGHVGHSFWRSSWGQNHLAQLAEETGGESYMLGFASPVSFAPYLDEIAGRLAHQYRVTLLMKPANKGEFRGIRFVTEVPNAELVGVTKVYVPAGADNPSR